MHCPHKQTPPKMSIAVINSIFAVCCLHTHTSLITAPLISILTPWTNKTIRNREHRRLDHRHDQAARSTLPPDKEGPLWIKCRIVIRMYPTKRARIVPTSTSTITLGFFVHTTIHQLTWIPNTRLVPIMTLTTPTQGVTIKHFLENFRLLTRHTSRYPVKRESGINFLTT